MVPYRLSHALIRCLTRILGVDMPIAARPAICASLRSLAALLVLGLLTPVVTAANAQQPNPDKCTSGELKPKTSTNISTTGAGSGESQPDLEVSGSCIVKTAGDYYYSKVNIVKGGKLIFEEPTGSTSDKVTNFWARSIIVENQGTLQAGDAQNPYGKNLHTLNIILYGKDQTNHDDPSKFPNGDPINNPAGGDTCIQTNCGVPTGTGNMWDDNGQNQFAGCGLNTGNGNGSNCFPGQPSDVKDYFYQYGPIMGTKSGYFGYKVLGVGYGGTLQLYGYKGTTLAAQADKDATDSGSSWVRLEGDIGQNATSLKVDAGFAADGKTARSISGDWQPGDKIVVTTTDYVPGHSEELIIGSVDKAKGIALTANEKTKWAHTGHKFDTGTLLGTAEASKLKGLGMDSALADKAETRAAVALLTRSIRIVSGGDFAGDYFDCLPTADKNTWFIPHELTHNNSYVDPVKPEKCATARNANYSFGATTVFRQGFAKVQIQGVEFHQMGVGGRMGHYPVHFHEARRVPPNAYVKDSSVSESMTRWFVLHSTQGVLLQRNVGWKSIGHGYYLESATETDNKFYSNIGILARAGVEGPDNNRNIPGILAANDYFQGDDFIYRSDILYPTVFWIPNGWNDFVGNMAAGADSLGLCYWWLAGGNSDRVDVPPAPIVHMKWSGYAGRQTVGHEGEAPLKLFYKNYCSTAMHSLDTTNGVSAAGTALQIRNTDAWKLKPIKSVAPDRGDPPSAMAKMYYPILGGNHKPTVCDPSIANDKQDACTGPYSANLGMNDNEAANVVKTCSNEDPKDCGVTVIDRYTTSFHWAETNFSALWLRSPSWYLVDNSFISDTQNGGVTFVTGGDYSRSSVPLGYWVLASRSIFVGATNPTNQFARAAGPPGMMEPKAGDNACDRLHGGSCISKQSSVAYPLSNWATGERLFNIYDGPAHQDANAYLEINVSPCNSATDGSCLYRNTPGVRKYQTGTNTGKGYLPNAAIGWKQPNGFYYPPAFHSKNLFFKDVDIRHYVILPILKPGTYNTDNTKLTELFVGGVEGSKNMMGNFTDIDRQTELNDDDGTLTGFKDTISVNEDGFFGAPTQAPQCRSNVGVDPAHACAGTIATGQTPPTARTSPYDYVTTVVYPGCAMNDEKTAKPPLGDKPFDGEMSDTACGSVHKDTHKFDGGGREIEREFRGGMWSKDCGGPFCYGVPIYRQYLTGDTASREWQNWVKLGCDKDPGNANCDFPFGRMAGTGTWQRSIMTVNHGKFYIDTSRSQWKQRLDEALGFPGEVTQQDVVECKDKDGKAWQKPGLNCTPRSVNVFEPGKTYFVFLVFAKKSTKQTYQMYVGDQCETQKDTIYKPIKITGTETRYNWAAWTEKPWTAECVEGSTKGVKDVLQVTMDFSKVTNADALFNPNPPTATNDRTCKPVSFCKWNGASSCGCNLSATDPRVLANPKLKDSCTKTCQEWAVKDLDCPQGGCLGFAFTLPKEFKADDKSHRPKAEPYPMTATDTWKTLKFTRVNAGGEGCGYSSDNTPDINSKTCAVPDCPMGETDPPLCTQKPPKK